jgi:hypothetical protein
MAKPHDQPLRNRGAAQLERSTITHQVNRLLEIGLVMRYPKGSPVRRRSPSDPPRHQQGLRLHHRHRDAGGGVLGGGVNLAGDVLRFKKENRAITSETFIDDVVGIARSFAAEMGGMERLLGVGVGMGGIIDSEGGSSITPYPCI